MERISIQISKQKANLRKAPNMTTIVKSKQIFRVENKSQHASKVDVDHPKVNEKKPTMCSLEFIKDETTGKISLRATRPVKGQGSIYGTKAPIEHVDY